MDVATAERELIERMKRFVKAELKRADVTYEELAAKLREMGVLDGLRTVVANSGNANAATGGAGLDQAARMQGAHCVAVDSPDNGQLVPTRLDGVGNNGPREAGQVFGQGRRDAIGT